MSIGNYAILSTNIQDMQVMANVSQVLQELRYNLPMANNHAAIPDNRLDFGAALRYYRRRAKINQDVLADLLNVTQPTLSRWENEAEPPKDTYILSRMAEILDVSLDDLYNARIPQAMKETQETYDAVDPLIALAKQLVEKHKGRTTLDEAIEILSGYLDLGDEARRHVRMQIGLLRRIPNIPPDPTDQTPNDAGGRG